MRDTHASPTPRYQMRNSITAFSLALSLALTTLASVRAEAPPTPNARTMFRRIELRSRQLARLVSSQLHRARVRGRRTRAQCLDTVLSQIHAVQRHATWHLERANTSDFQRRTEVARVLSERLQRLGAEQRRCLGMRRAQHTEVTVEVAPWVPREAPL